MTSATVVVTNHDYARFVREAVDSALAQTWDDTQVVVVDDGSTDGSRDTLASYGERIHLVLQPQRGQTAAMGAGLTASRGAVVLFLDADDVLLPGAVEAAVAALAGGAVKVHWPVELVDESGARLGSRLPAAALPSGDLRQLALRAGPQSLPFPPTSGNAWRRDLLEEVFPLPELEAALGVGSASADALLSMLAVLDGEVAALPDPLALYRVHGRNDYTGSGLLARIDRHVAVTDQHFAFVARHRAARGLVSDVDAWRAGSYFHRLHRVRAAVLSAVPRSGTVLLVDDAHWGPELVPERRLLPFPSTGGRWAGPPADDDAACSALERAVGEHGASHLLLAAHCSWWLDAYPALAQHLHARARLLQCDDDLDLYDLTGARA